MSQTSLKRRRLALLSESFAARFRSFVGARHFPCVGAKSALNRGRLHFKLFDRLSDQQDAEALCASLAAFAEAHVNPGQDPVSFVAMFRQDVANEDVFHDDLWRHLQAMHDVDAVEHDWDQTVSSDAADSGFSFSIAERAFFVVGLHPKSSRLARRAPFPCLVFNFHDQFEALRASGKYDQLKTAIRARDVALQGSVNPVLAAFGESSEARQYSGRADLKGGTCPFHARLAEAA